MLLKFNFVITTEEFSDRLAIFNHGIIVTDRDDIKAESMILLTNDEGALFDSRVYCVSFRDKVDDHYVLSLEYLRQVYDHELKEYFERKQ